MLWFELPNTQQTKNLNVGIIYEAVVYKQLLISCYICGKDVASLSCGLVSQKPASRQPAMPLSTTLDELLKPEVTRPHRGHDFLLNLAYECTPNFGEDYEQYLNKPLTMLAPNSDEKVSLLVT